MNSEDKGPLSTQDFTKFTAMTKSRLVAIIDCGTNTFHLMLAQTGKEGTQIVHTEKTTVKIGQGGIENKVITEEAGERALECIRTYAAKIRDAGAMDVLAFATSAFRNARNGESLRDQIEKETGIRISIIPGEEEAGLIADGVRLALDIGEEPALIMDIGGGSVEFIIATEESVYWKQSFEIGAQRLLDRFYQQDPIPEESVIRLQLFLSEALKPLIRAVETYSPATLIGASGTFDTLSTMYAIGENLESSGEESEIPLTLAGYYALHEKILTTTTKERLNIPGMVEMRVDMIVVASCLIDFVLKMSGIRQLRVSRYALKEGALARLAGKET